MYPVKPRQFGDRERRHRHAADRFGPVLGGAELSDEPICIVSRLHVVPQLGGVNRLIRAVECDHPVLLASDTQCGDLEGLSLRPGVDKRRPPGVRILLADRWRDGGVSGTSGCDHFARLEVTDLDLGRLRARVNSCDQWHFHNVTDGRNRRGCLAFAQRRAYTFRT